jgi:hypothetical protein
MFEKFMKLSDCAAATILTIGASCVLLPAIASSASAKDGMDPAVTLSSTEKAWQKVVEFDVPDDCSSGSCFVPIVTVKGRKAVEISNISCSVNSANMSLFYLEVSAGGLLPSPKTYLPIPSPVTNPSLPAAKLYAINETTDLFVFGGNAAELAMGYADDGGTANAGVDCTFSGKLFYYK